MNINLLETAIGDELMRGLDALIAEAPDGGYDHNLPIVIPDRILSEDYGWPDKYQSHPVLLSGEAWWAAYDSASVTIAKQGIAVLHGKRGPGKTQMAAEIARSYPMARYTTAMSFFLEIRKTFQKGSKITELDVIEAMTKCPLLVIDEIQERGDTEWENRLLTHIIDARYSAVKPTILIANLTKDELMEKLSPSIIDRINENGKRIEFIWDSFRSKKPATA